MACYPALTHAHTRRVPGVTGSAKRRFINRGRDVYTHAGNLESGSTFLPVPADGGIALAKAALDLA